MIDCLTVRIFTLYLGLAFVFLPLVGCAVGDGKPHPALTFSQIPVIEAPVGSIEVIQGETTVAGAAEKNAAFTEPPDQLVFRYLNSHLRATGESGRELRVALKKTNISVSLEEGEDTLKRWFWIARYDRYDVNMELELTLYDPGMRETQSTVLRFNRFVRIPDYYSLSAREDALAQTLERLIYDVDAGVRKSLKNTFGLL